MSHTTECFKITETAVLSLAQWEERNGVKIASVIIRRNGQLDHSTEVTIRHEADHIRSFLITEEMNRQYKRETGEDFLPLGFFKNNRCTRTGKPLKRK